MGVVGIGCGGRRSQYEFVVENVEALVLHGPHVEGGYRDDHENVEVVFAAKRFLVPAHGALETVHRVERAIFLARLDVNVQGDLAARHRGETIGDARQPPADKREQITGFFERIMPDGKVPIGAGYETLRHQIAVGEQYRRLVLVGFNAWGVDRHHVRTVEKISDAAEALGLALRAIGRTSAIKAHQLRVGRRVDQRLDLEVELPVWRLGNGQLLRRGEVAFLRQFLAVDRERAENEVFAVKHERSRRTGAVRL